MHKDNFLFAVIGLLFGFIAGYLTHEVMLARQPLRRLAGEAGAVSTGPAQDSPEGPAGAAEASDAQPPAGTAGAAETGAETASGAAGTAAPGGGEAMDGASGRAAGGVPPMAAVQQLRDYVSTHPKDAAAVLKLANLNFDIQNWARARDLYRQYLDLRPSNPDVLTDLGNCYRKLLQFDSALLQFHRAEQLAPAHWKSLYSEVVLLTFDLKQLDAADKAMARLEGVAPGQPEVKKLAVELQQRRRAGG